MDTSTILISILLPTFNGDQRIARAIESVQAQTYQNWELLIIDDGSIAVEKTAAVVAGFSNDQRIRFLKNEKNVGIQKTLNKGIAEARGDYIARIDDDDRWSDTDKLRLQVAYIQTHPSCVLVGTGTIIVDEENKELIRYLLPTEDSAIRNKILGKNCFVHSSVVFKKTAAQSVGGYDESPDTLHLEDYDLWLKLGTVGELANIPIYGVTFMLRDDGLSSKNKISQAKKAIGMAKKYKKDYPGYYFAIVRSAIRLVVYGFILQFPVKIFVNRLAKWYKENW